MLKLGDIYLTFMVEVSCVRALSQYKVISIGFLAQDSFAHTIMFYSLLVLTNPHLAEAPV